MRVKDRHCVDCRIKYTPRRYLMDFFESVVKDQAPNSIHLLDVSMYVK